MRSAWSHYEGLPRRSDYTGTSQRTQKQKEGKQRIFYRSQRRKRRSFDAEHESNASRERQQSSLASLPSVKFLSLCPSCSSVLILLFEAQGAIAVIRPGLSEIYRGYIACLNQQDWSNLAGSLMRMYPATVSRSAYRVTARCSKEIFVKSRTFILAFNC